MSISFDALAASERDWLLKHAYKYAHDWQNMLDEEAHAYAKWYVENFPEGEAAHSDRNAFFLWIRTADTRYRNCYPLEDYQGNGE